jgi:hypothetical protein
MLTAGSRGKRGHTLLDVTYSHGQCTYAAVLSWKSHKLLWISNPRLRPSSQVKCRKYGLRVESPLVLSRSGSGSELKPDLEGGCCMSQLVCNGIRGSEWCATREKYDTHGTSNSTVTQFIVGQSGRRGTQRVRGMFGATIVRHPKTMQEGIYGQVCYDKEGKRERKRT